VQMNTGGRDMTEEDGIRFQPHEQPIYLLNEKPEVVKIAARVVKPKLNCVECSLSRWCTQVVEREEGY
jgi:hypothetical protein